MVQLKLKLKKGKAPEEYTLTNLAWKMADLWDLNFSSLGSVLNVLHTWISGCVNSSFLHTQIARVLVHLWDPWVIGSHGMVVGHVIVHHKMVEHKTTLGHKASLFAVLLAQTVLNWQNCKKSQKLETNWISWPEPITKYAGWPCYLVQLAGRVLGPHGHGTPGHPDGVVDNEQVWVGGWFR